MPLSVLHEHRNMLLLRTNVSGPAGEIWKSAEVRILTLVLWVKDTSPAIPRSSLHVSHIPRHCASESTRNNLVNKIMELAASPRNFSIAGPWRPTGGAKP